MSYPYCKTPCKNCPFRKDTLKGWLGEERMIEILNQGSFVCHKTSNKKRKDRRQCAGHMIIKGGGNDFVDMAKVLGVELELRGKELVFDNESDCIKHHKR